MPLTSETAAPVFGQGNPPRRINARIVICDKIIPSDLDAVIFDGPAEQFFGRCLRVDVAKAAEAGGHNTAFNRAVSWLAEVLREGRTVGVVGPHAEAIVTAHLVFAGFDLDEATRMIQGV